MSDNVKSFGGQDVAVFIDFENIYISVLAEYDVNPDFEALIEKAEDFGRVSVAQAYADWTPYSHYINSLHAYQIDPMYVPAYHYGEGGKQKGGAIKNSVDMFLCINAMKMLYSHPNIQTFVLVTGDRDFVPLIKTIREFGKRAVVIGVAGAASAHLAQSADEFFFYHQITDNLKPPEKERPRVRDPYETLVEAVKLARQRGYVATLASLKLLMAELMGEFDESKYKDNRGKPIQKFKDFVREAERRNKVKLFSTGTINEVFLPNEDPRKTSRFVEELLPPAEPVDEVDEPEEAEEESKVEVEVTKDQWKLFIQAMSPVEGAVPFVRVFDVLRGLRNQGLLDLSNKEVKGMIIKAIHLNLLNRSNRGRGRRTFYQLTADPKVLGQYVELPAPSPISEAIAAPSLEGERPVTEASIMEAQITREMDTDVPRHAFHTEASVPAYDINPATAEPVGVGPQYAEETAGGERAPTRGEDAQTGQGESAAEMDADRTPPSHAEERLTAGVHHGRAAHEVVPGDQGHAEGDDAAGHAVLEHAAAEPEQSPAAAERAGASHAGAHGQAELGGAERERGYAAQPPAEEPPAMFVPEPEAVTPPPVEERKPRRSRAAATEEASASASVAPPAFAPLAAEPVKRERATPPRTRRGRGKAPATPTYVTYEMGEPVLDAPAVDEDRDSTQPPAEAQSEE